MENVFWIKIKMLNFLFYSKNICKKTLLGINQYFFTNAIHANIFYTCCRHRSPKDSIAKSPELDLTN